MWGSLRIGVFVVGAGWGYQVAGFTLSQDARDLGALLLGTLVLIATFNAGHAGALSSGKAILLCSVLALGWMGWWWVLLSMLLRS
ncbi:hypothetical protein [Serratia grimesii]|uniref:hypothetical protein n=1 Tax=Serratia grimesii TaxID=82995 RepID=UPI0039B0CF97